jgi:penicillin-binding protein-related factor A (putative recombinase)
MEIMPKNLKGCSLLDIKETEQYIFYLVDQGDLFFIDKEEDGIKSINDDSIRNISAGCADNYEGSIYYELD